MGVAAFGTGTFFAGVIFPAAGVAAFFTAGALVFFVAAIAGFFGTVFFAAGFFAAVATVALIVLDLPEAAPLFPGLVLDVVFFADGFNFFSVMSISSMMPG